MTADRSKLKTPSHPPGHELLHASEDADSTASDAHPHTATHTIDQFEGPEVPLLQSKPHRSPFGALLSRTLPEYSGKYSVGVCDVEVPTARRTFGNFKHKSMPDAAAGLTMDSVLFTLFYPTEKPKKFIPVVWFPSLKQTIDGFLKMARRTPNFWYRMVAYPLAAATVWGTTFPAQANAPLLPPPPNSKGEQGKWPLMIFSHGVGCSRLMYSAFCGEMASRGYIVAALEHRDGTSPSSKIISEDGEERMLHWLEWRDLEWPDLDPQPPNDTTIRHEQVKLRCAEVEETIKAISLLTSISSPFNDSSLSDVTNPASDVKGTEAKSDLAARVRAQQTVCDTSNLMLLGLRAPESMDWRLWEGKVNADSVVMAGHSLGGAVALEMSARKSIPFKAVVAMDPAVQRCEPWTGTLPHPLLIVNSEEFTVGKEYAIWASQIKDTVQEDVKKKSSVFTIPGSTHPSFSDIFLILPEKVNRFTGLKVAAHTVLELCVGAVWDFVNGKTQATRSRATPYSHATRTSIPRTLSRASLALSRNSSSFFGSPSGTSKSISESEENTPNMSADDSENKTPKLGWSPSGLQSKNWKPKLKGRSTSMINVGGDVLDGAPSISGFGHDYSGNGDSPMGATMGANMEKSSSGMQQVPEDRAIESHDLNVNEHVNVASSSGNGSPDVGGEDDEQNRVMQSKAEKEMDKKKKKEEAKEADALGLPRKPVGKPGELVNLPL